LAADPGDRFDIVMTNPPFGKKSSTTIVGEEGQVSKERDIVERDDFWATTSNKQLNFVQHVKTLLKQNGRAGVVVPDNVLFEGGAGESVRRKLLHECDMHTLLRLPTGLFYAQGVKANVLFFDKKAASETPWTKKLWIYDLRTNQHFTLKTDPLKREDLDEFVTCYNPTNRHTRKATWSDKKPDGRSRAYGYDELIARDSLWWLHEGHRAIRVGDWKLVAAKGDPWELYDLKTDRAEQHNLATRMPDKVAELERTWQQQTDSFTTLAQKSLTDQPRPKGKAKAKAQK
jgi:type I restriction enzyme M protein